MPKVYRPMTGGTRHRTGPSFTEITKSKPEKSLLRPLKKSGGRNAQGRITSRHRGGGHRRAYRVIDFKRNKHDVGAKVLGVEYDPNRSARLALLQYEDGEKRYIISPAALRVGDTVMSGPSAEMKPGNALPLKGIVLGTTIHNIELTPGRGGQIVRSAGSGAQLMARDAGFAHVKLPSGEVRKIREDCYATVGQVGNVEHEVIVSGKAGRTRWLGRRPKVRGVAMNPVDHPHGGGEGRASQGNPHPVSPWGVATKGLKTRKGKKQSDRYIVKRRTR